MTEQLPCPRLYAGYDAGFYTLPDAIVHVRTTYRGIEAMPYPKPPKNAFEVVEDVARETVDAVQNGTKLPDVRRMEQAREAQRIYEDALNMMDLCFSIAVGRAREAFAEHGHAIITDHLRPAFADMWSAVQDATRTLVEHGERTPRRLLSAPAKVRKASDTLDQMAARYEAIVGARDELWHGRGIRCPQDPQGKYTTVRNFHTLHPVRLAVAKPGWYGLDTRDYLMWMVDHGGQLWLPTPDEQAQAVAEEAHIGVPGQIPGAIRVTAA